MCCLNIAVFESCHVFLGEVGLSGNNGRPGRQGSVGIIGSPGPPGVQGVAGGRGPTGLSIKGERGVDGKLVLFHWLFVYISYAMSNVVGLIKFHISFMFL